jgi:hypothetical protein
MPRKLLTMLSKKGAYLVMVRYLVALVGCAAVVAVAISLSLPRQTAIADMTPKNAATLGFTLHIDADKHFGAAHPKERAHHFCKAINPNLTECELYDSDSPNARLVGVEMVVPGALWKTFPASEQALWHYHKLEIPKVNATLPDTPKDKQAAIVKSLEPTYGKIYILWDPMTSTSPMGQPSVTVLK